MLDFDYVCRRDTPSIAALVSPGRSGGFIKLFFGPREVLIPLFDSIKDACAAHNGASVFLNFASTRSNHDATMLALCEPTLRVHVIAEPLPGNSHKNIILHAKDRGVTVIGPMSGGVIQGGGLKLGEAGGSLYSDWSEFELHRPGSVGVVTRSSTNDIFSIVSKTTDGLFEGVSIGSSPEPCSTLADHVLRFQKMPEICLIVMVGGDSGTGELDVATLIKEERVTKPLAAWVSAQDEHPKNVALASAGAHVSSSFEGLAKVIEDVFKMQKHQEPLRIVPPALPMDYSEAVRANIVRRPTNIISTVCDDRGDVCSYSGIPVTQLINSGSGIGDVVALLWFKHTLPGWATRFIELVLMLTADHGPCVSGAHSAIVASRAGKDLVSCVASGLLTVGPLFGGAIDDAARAFREAVDRQIPPSDFVAEMKKRRQRIAGIGHRIKSTNYIDKRVELLDEFASQHFPDRVHFQYARRVEAETVQTANNLVLNVDGCIGALFLDLMAAAGVFSNTEIDEIVHTGVLNGLFVLGRTIGLIAHALDQKRLHQGVYRHPSDDVLYL